MVAVFKKYTGDFSAFSTATGAVVVRGIMMILMEIIIIVIFETAGFLVKKFSKEEQELAKMNRGMQAPMQSTQNGYQA